MSLESKFDENQSEQDDWKIVRQLLPVYGLYEIFKARSENEPIVLEGAPQRELIQYAFYQGISTAALVAGVVYGLNELGQYISNLF